MTGQKNSEPADGALGRQALSVQAEPLNPSLNEALEALRPFAEKLAREMAKAIAEFKCEGWPIYVTMGYESAEAFADHEAPNLIRRASDVYTRLTKGES